MQPNSSHRLYRFVAAAGLIIAPAFGWTADWTIHQTVTTSAYIILNQGVNQANNDALQALNVINLASGEDVNNNSSPGGQTVTLNTNDLTLKQAGSGSGNVQAANALLAEVVDNVYQRVRSIEDASLKQSSTGNGNVQALNIAQFKRMALVQQNVHATTVTLDNRGVAANNSQAINYIQEKNSSVPDISRKMWQIASLATLIIHTDGSFDSTGRYGQAVNLFMGQPPSTADAMNQVADIGTLNVNGSPAAKVMAVMNRMVTP